MVIMGPQTTPRPSGGYGPQEPEIPDIFLEEDLDLPNQSNPIEDVDLGDGQMIFRPETSPVVVEGSLSAEDTASLCRGTTTTDYMVANPRECTTYYSCQSAGQGRWIANPKTCSGGTVFNPASRSCDYPENVSGRCHSNRGGDRVFLPSSISPNSTSTHCCIFSGRRARVLGNFNFSEDGAEHQEDESIEEKEFLKVFEEVNNALYSRQTHSKLSVDSAPQFLAFTSASSSCLPGLVILVLAVVLL